MERVSYSISGGGVCLSLGIYPEDQDESSSEESFLEPDEEGGPGLMRLLLVDPVPADVHVREAALRFREGGTFDPLTGCVGDYRIPSAEEATSVISGAIQFVEQDRHGLLFCGSVPGVMPGAHGQPIEVDWVGLIASGMGAYMSRSGFYVITGSKEKKDRLRKFAGAVSTWVPHGDSLAYSQPLEFRLCDPDHQSGRQDRMDRKVSIAEDAYSMAFPAIRLAQQDADVHFHVRMALERAEVHWDSSRRAFCYALKMDLYDFNISDDFYFGDELQAWCKEGGDLFRRRPRDISGLEFTEMTSEEIVRLIDVGSIAKPQLRYFDYGSHQRSHPLPQGQEDVAYVALERVHGRDFDLSVVGVAWVVRKPDTATLSYISVDPGWHRKGVASQIFTMLAEDLVARNMPLVRTKPGKFTALGFTDYAGELLTRLGVAWGYSTLEAISSREIKQLERVERFSV